MKQFGTNNFLVEVEDEELESLLKPVKIYVNGHVLGDSREVTYLPIFHAKLSSLSNKPRVINKNSEKLGNSYYRDKLLLAASLPTLSEAEYIDYIEKYIPDYDDYLFNFDTAFDHYTIRMAKTFDNIYILWYITSLGEGDDTGIYFTEISYENIQEAFREFEIWYHQLKRKMGLQI